MRNNNGECKLTTFPLSILKLKDLSERPILLDFLGNDPTQATQDL